jgi:hypothetical protein
LRLRLVSEVDVLLGLLFEDHALDDVFVVGGGVEGDLGAEHLAGPRLAGLVELDGVEEVGVARQRERPAVDLPRLADFVAREGSQRPGLQALERGGGLRLGWVGGVGVEEVRHGRQLDLVVAGVGDERRLLEGDGRVVEGHLEVDRGGGARRRRKGRRHGERRFPLGCARGRRRRRGLVRGHLKGGFPGWSVAGEVDSATEERVGRSGRAGFEGGGDDDLSVEERIKRRGDLFDGLIP